MRSVVYLEKEERGFLYLCDLALCGRIVSKKIASKFREWKHPSPQFGISQSPIPGPSRESDIHVSLRTPPLSPILQEGVENSVIGVHDVPMYDPDLNCLVNIVFDDAFENL